MPNLISNSQNLRLLLPEIIWLQPEHFLFAKQTSSPDSHNSSYSWQIYINTIALLALEEWLSERLSNQSIYRDTSTIKIAGNLKVDEFKFCAIATEHLLDEIVNIPQSAIENPELAAHFYVLLEVLEEEQEVGIKGFLTYNQIVKIKSDLSLCIAENCYQLPLSLFDIEPNHILSYHRYIKASEFGLPIADNQVTRVSEQLSTLVIKTTTKLSQWLQGVIDEGWQTIDSLSSSELNLAFITRNIENRTRQAKLIDLGLDFNNRKLALLINISSEQATKNQDEDNTEKISILAQLYPMEGEKFLPQNIKLSLISKAGITVQEVSSRIQDNYIQLKPFKGKVGKKFAIQISLGDMVVKEYFEL